MKINGLNFKVKYGCEEGMGRTSAIYQIIEINEELIDMKENLKRTVMHEVIHAYLYAYGFTNKDQFELEQMIEFISNNYDNIGKLTEQALKELDKEVIK